MRITELKKGDIYRLENNAWTSYDMFLGISYYDKKKHDWTNELNENTRICLHGFRYNEKTKSASQIPFFQWFNNNQECFLKD